MTKQRTKALERFYVEQFLLLTGRSDSIEESERPDFMLCGSAGREGLEVTYVFKDAATFGSPTKRAERVRTAFLSAAAQDYYNAGGRPLVVRVSISATPSSELRRELVSALLRSQDLPLTVATRLSDAPDGLTIWATALPDTFPLYRRWLCVNDVVGWIHTLTSRQLAACIADKARALTAYRRAADRVSLLIVADRRFNSGRLQWVETGILVDGSGYDSVHLLIYPEEVHRIF